MYHISIRCLIMNSFWHVPRKSRVHLNALPSSVHVAETNVQTACTLLTQLHQNTVNTQHSVSTFELKHDRQIKAYELQS